MNTLARRVAVGAGLCPRHPHVDYVLKIEFLMFEGNRLTRTPHAGMADAPPRRDLRPFFGFYGGKWRDAPKNYPTPAYEQIVEPFAGSAGYAVRYYDRRVTLCERDPIIAGVWRYLIAAKASEILKIPDVPLNGSVDDLTQTSEEARWLVGFWLNRGTARPRKRPSLWMRDGIRPGSFWGDRVRNTIASQVDAIRHWKIVEGNFDKAPNIAATWFIDPPYQRAGSHYRFGASGLDYDELAEWCRGRRGQVIVCENEGADWLPFEPLARVKTTRTGRRSVEVRWVSTERS